MGLLAPLYLAGFLAIGFPILFHLIRRNPHGRRQFSSLMFLAASPPRLTRRSRLTNILLLILRALAFSFLVLAFARPFLTHAQSDSTAASGRRIALLVDTSASMRRGDLWKQANAQIDQALHNVTPTDQVALYFFDRQLKPAFTFDEWNHTDRSQRLPLLRTRLAATTPGWQPTRVGDALSTLAELLAEPADSSRNSAAKPGEFKTRQTMPGQIILISDLQQGARPEALQGHQWPANVSLMIRPVTTASGNAGISWVEQSAQDDSRSDGKLRIRISNQPDSKSEQFILTWANDKGPVAAAISQPSTQPAAAILPNGPLKIYVPPGRTQILHIPWPDVDTKVDRLLLTGDDADFDNTLFVVPPRTESIRVLYIGDEPADDVKDLRYYLQSAWADTPRRKVEILARRLNENLTDADAQGIRLAIITGTPSAGTAARLQKFAQTGGDVLIVIKNIAAIRAVEAFGMGTWESREAIGDFALLAHVETTHPLFAPFADARFADFTKIHFWHHRSVTLPIDPSLHVLAAFDHGDPFLIEKSLGTGTLRVMTSGWQPADSQFALSTKFVPLLEGLLARKDDVSVAAQYSIGDPIALPPATTNRAITTPDGKHLDLPAAATSYDAAQIPGIYHFSLNNGGGGDTLIALNVNPDESRTTPIAAEEFERWGAHLALEGAAADEKNLHEHQLKVAELENRQKLWRWLILGVLGLLAVETVLAGVAARRSLQTEATS